MKKIIVLSALAFFGTASAQDLQQYLSLKGSAVILKTDLTGDSSYTNKANVKNSLDKKGHDTVAGFRLAYGLIFPVGEQQMRGELEYGLNGNTTLHNDIVFKAEGVKDANVATSSKIKSQFLMANLYYDFLNHTDFTPYLTAGIGYSHLKAHHSFSFAGMGSSFDDSNNNFVWNVGIGVAYKITNNLNLDTSYRYINFGKVDADNSLNVSGLKFNHVMNTKTKLTANEFNLGIRYTF